MSFLGDGILPDATDAEIRHQQHRLAFVQVDVGHHAPPAASLLASVSCLPEPSVAAQVSAVNGRFETITRRVQEIRRRVPYVAHFHSALPWMTLRPVVPCLTPERCPNVAQTAVSARIYSST